jgi:uncharacterized protein (DUF1015 family)
MSDQRTLPFRGIIYNKNRVDDIASCVCPPYDVISDDGAYLRRSPFNAVRLELPTPLADADKYENARRTFREWLSDGVLTPDSRETIYIYEQEFEMEGASYLRRGFIALNKLDRGRILTHEQTRKKAKDDREKLITSLGAFTSLVFGLYEDKDLEMERILEGARKEVIYDFPDEMSVRNRFYRMADQEEMARLTTLMNARNIYVADGHHRLDVSYRLNIPYIPLYLTNMYSRGIVILPYHRMIKFEESRSLSGILTLLEKQAGIEKLPYTGPQSVAAVLRTIAAADRPSFALYSAQDPGHLYVLTVTSPEAGDSPLDRLKVNVLHKGILKELLGVREEEISFAQDPVELMRAVEERNVDLAFLLPPTTAGEVKEVADKGLDMPPKSTFFYPKILTGLVFYTYV